MRRAVVGVALFFVWAPGAHAAPSVSISAPSLIGQAPYDVTLTAAGSGDSFTWDFGDGTSGSGRVVTHRYATGRYVATVTAAEGGETAQATAVVIAATLSLAPPRAATFGRRGLFAGRMTPAIPGARITLEADGQPVAAGSANRGGRFKIRVPLGKPAPYTARFGAVVSNTLRPAIRPRLDLAAPGARMVGQRLLVSARLRPAGAGRIELRVWRNGRRRQTAALAAAGAVRLATRVPAQYVVQAVVRGTGGFATVTRTLRTNVYVPYLGPGAHGASVRMLESRLAELRYALRGIDGYYGSDTYEAVLAFQKVNGLARTGRMGPSLWRRLQAAGVPRPRRHEPFHHVEVDKRRQVLFEVRDAKVVRVVHVSTGATGNTPVGRWRIYSKVPGTLPTGMYYSSFFVGAFAIHGYPSVPAYPASHGCVRVPMWIAPRLFTAHPYGLTVYIY